MFYYPTRYVHVSCKKGKKKLDVYNVILQWQEKPLLSCIALDFHIGILSIVLKMNHEFDKAGKHCIHNRFFHIIVIILVQTVFYFLQIKILNRLFFNVWNGGNINVWTFHLSFGLIFLKFRLLSIH